MAKQLDVSCVRSVTGAPAHVCAAVTKEIDMQETRNRQSSVPSVPTKQDQVIALMRRAKGTTLSDIVAKTGWQPHSVRGFISAVVRKRLRLNVVTDRTSQGVLRYRISKSDGV